MSTPHRLVVAQYDRGEGNLGKEHWSLVLFEDRDAVWTFQILGNQDTYEYVPGRHENFTSSRSYRGGCAVGTVTADKVEWVMDKLREVTIIRGDASKFNCQTFVMDGLRLLKYAEEEGVVITVVDRQFIINELAQERENWETAGCTVEERLFPEAEE
ncbi:hypothetical protein M413DRAFT_448873 [Hebeloma cylindrosporum]|uniref:Uncharacterized protein n=1 Tax=Hebeloma cylindrosporum TaxID=76867 RepID=A0A0C3BZ58_HEBCY|nr:hypothetical protein M413DRAFT_448873 [Hebeloma cylindrosporum h7]